MNIRGRLPWLLALLAPALLLGQDRPRIELPASVTCTDCGVHVSRVVRLGDADGPGSFAGFPASVTRDSRGRYLVIVQGDPPQIFDSRGQFLQLLGRQGQGPGEFQRPAVAVVLPGDSILVTESTRYSVFAPDLRYVRSGLTPRVFGANTYRATLLRNGDLVVSGLETSPGATGYPFHRMARNGRITSFGPIPPGDREGRPSLSAMQMMVSPAARDNFWAADRTAVSLFDARGTLLRSFGLAAPWLNFEVTPPEPGPPTQPPHPYLWHIRNDRAGTLWLAFNVSGPRWREGTLPGPGRGVRFVFHYLYETLLVAVDEESGQVKGSTRIPGHLLHFIDDQHYAMLVEAEDGTPYVEVWRMRVVAAQRH